MVLMNNKDEFSINKIRNLARGFFELPRAHKTVVAMLYDFILVCATSIFASYLTYKTAFPEIVLGQSNNIILLALLSVCTYFVLGLYKSIIRMIGEKTLFLIFLCTLLTANAWELWVSGTQGYNFNHAVVFWAILTITIGIPRLTVRSFVMRLNSHLKKRVIIYGAGQAGRQLAHAIKLGHEYQLAAFVDDHKDLHGSRIDNTTVYSPTELESLIPKYSVERILLAVPSATRQRRNEIIASLEHYPVKIKSIADISDIISGKAQVDDIYDIDIEDILGREPVEPDHQLFTEHNEGKVVLVTGAGGSIGSELCRQLIKSAPKQLILLDVSEFALYEISQELNRVILIEELSIDLVSTVGSVQNRLYLNSIFKHYNVDTVYHAAAYKHVPIVEHNIAQGFLNNVIGTWNIATASEQFNVEKFVLISTDKAVRPTNFMGASKRMAELVIQAMSQNNAEFHCAIVRFGNVLGSSGSVVPLFREQIKSGGPITVTHRDVIRYFMTIPEAAQLVIQAGAMGKKASVFVLDMGEPVKISDLAERMIKLSGLTIRNEANPNGDIAIEYTGLRQGEKLYEELLIGEDTTGTKHPRILAAKEKFHSWEFMKEALFRLQSYIDLNDIQSIFELVEELEIDFDQQYPISDPLYSQLHATTDNVIALKTVLKNV